MDTTINLFREQFHDYAPDADQARETEANRFAAALLMPEPLMRREFAQNPESNSPFASYSASPPKRVGRRCLFRIGVVCYS